MTILGTGLSGLVGSRIVEILTPEFQFINLSKETGVDITNYSEIQKHISAFSGSWVFHLAAYTDVQGAESDRQLGKESAAWKVNVDATANLVKLCNLYQKHLVYLSTDYVFDGKNAPYTELSQPHPLGWYAETKYEGEKVVETMGDMGLVIRIANPYRAHPVGKKDFLHKMKERLEAKLPIKAASDQKMSATFIDDLALVMKTLISHEAYGIYHVPGGDVVTPYEAAVIIAKAFHLDASLISPTTFDAYFSGKAPIPKDGTIKHDKIDNLGIELHTFTSGVAEVVRQETLKEE